MKLLRKNRWFGPVLVFLASPLLSHRHRRRRRRSRTCRYRKRRHKKAKARSPFRSTLNFAPIDALVQEKIDDQSVPGRCWPCGHDGSLIIRRLSVSRHITAAGAHDRWTRFRSGLAHKVVATAPSVMRLVQYGQCAWTNRWPITFPILLLTGRTALQSGNCHALFRVATGPGPEHGVGRPGDGVPLGHEEKLNLRKVHSSFTATSISLSWVRWCSVFPE